MIMKNKLDYVSDFICILGIFLCLYIITGHEEFTIQINEISSYELFVLSLPISPYIYLFILRLVSTSMLLSKLRLLATVGITGYGTYIYYLYFIVRESNEAGYMLLIMPLLQGGLVTLSLVILVIVNASINRSRKASNKSLKNGTREELRAP